MTVGGMWGSSGGGVALLSSLGLAFSIRHSSGMVLPGFIVRTGRLTLSMWATGRTLDGGGSHIDLDDIWRFDLDDLEARSGASTWRAVGPQPPWGWRKPDSRPLQVPQRFYVAGPWPQRRQEPRL